MDSWPSLEPAFVAAMVQEAFAASNDLLLVTDNSFVIHFVSTASARLLGYERSDLVGKSGIDFVHPDDAVIFLTIAVRVTEGFIPEVPGLFRIKHADGSWRTLELYGGPFEHEGEIAGFWVVARPPLRAEMFTHVLGSVLDDQPLVRALAPVPVVLAEASDRCSISCWGMKEPDFTVGHELPAALNGSERPAGSPFAEACATGEDVYADDLSLLDAKTAALAAAEGLGSYAITPIRGAGDVVTALVTLWTATEDAPAYAAQRTMGVRELVQAAIAIRYHFDNLEELARSDTLTGLGNRLAFEDGLEAAGHPAGSVIFYIDLDYFKDVNDVHGHATGDAVLQAAAARIKAAVRAADVVARLGGDEFAVLCHNCGESEGAELAERIQSALREPVVFDGIDIDVRASIGAAAASTADRELLSRADAALYEAKRAGRDALRFSPN